MRVTHRYVRVHTSHIPITYGYIQKHKSDTQVRCEYIEDIKQWRKDMNFFFEWKQKTIFYERGQRGSKILFFYQEKIKFISSSHRVIFFLLCRQGRERHASPHIGQERHASPHIRQ